MQSIELALAAPQVIAQRTARMLAAGHSPTMADQQEFVRMGAEKIEAWVEIWTAMGMQVARANQEVLVSMMRMWSMPWSGLSLSTPALSRRTVVRGLERTGLALLASAVAPMHRRAVANAKRLRRRKR
jgi:hypothetical protein